MDDAEQCASRGSVETARAIYAHALKVFPNKKSIWIKAAYFEKAKGTQYVLCERKKRKRKWKGKGRKGKENVYGKGKSIFKSTWGGKSISRERGEYIKGICNDMKIYQITHCICC